MSLRRIWSVFLRYFYHFTKLDTMSEMFYWPAIDILLWGITSIWIQSRDTQIPDIALVILTGLVFWQVIWRGHYEVTISLLQEFWNRNLVNLFSTSLKLSEWMVATMLVGIGKTIITVIFSTILVWLLYTLNVYTLGWYFLPFIAMLILSGWIIGFISAAFIIYYGQRLQMLAWMTPFIFAPFSAVFYPVTALPQWGQAIAWCLPMTYIFEGMRKILTTGEFSSYYYWMSFILNIVFIIFALGYFKIMFEKSRNKGLGRLE